MATSKDIKWVLILLAVAIFISFFLSINSVDFRSAGYILGAMGIFSWLVYKKGGVL